MPCCTQSPSFTRQCLEDHQLSDDLAGDSSCHTVSELRVT